LQLRPQLEALLAASDRALRAAPHMPAHDATGVLQFVERAGTHHQVRVSKLSAARQVAGGDLGSGPVPETISLEVEGAGRFHALANWISELETAPWLRLERWRLAPGDDRHHVHQATLTLTAVSEPIK